MRLEFIHDNCATRTPKEDIRAAERTYRIELIQNHKRKWGYKIYDRNGTLRKEYPQINYTKWGIRWDATRALRAMVKEEIHVTREVIYQANT